MCDTISETEILAQTLLQLKVKAVKNNFLLN